MAISVDWPARIINIPKADLVAVGPQLYELDTNTLRLVLKDREDDEMGMAYPDTHRHNTIVSLGGVTLARTFEIINGYTITFEDGQYAVRLVGTNNNVADVTNINQVSVRPNNSAGLIEIQQREIQYASFNGGVTIDTVYGVEGTAYPAGSASTPVKTLVDALTIANLNGFQQFFVRGNLTIGATDDVSNYRFLGAGATLSVTKTLVTLTPGCITTNTEWYHCRVTGRQGGESTYTQCIIEALTNAHCHFSECGFVHSTSSSTMELAAGVPNTYDAYCDDCYSDYGTVVIDRNGTGINETFDHWVGRIKFVNQNRADNNGTVWVRLAGGSVTIDASCTTGTFVISGDGDVTNNSGGSVVDVVRLNGITPQDKLDIADAVLDRDLAAGVDSGSSVVRTLRQALRAIRNKVFRNVAAGTITVYKEDDTTPDWVAHSVDDDDAPPLAGWTPE